MKAKGKKFTALLLIFSLIEISCATITSPTTERRFPEKKRGAIVITKKDGQQIEGELITVKPKLLLLLNTDGKDVSVDIADIKVIRIVKKSKAGTGALVGVLICGGGTALYHEISFKENHEQCNKHVYTVIYALIAGAAGLLVGAIIGANAGRDKTFQLEGMSDSEIQEALDKLRKKARIRDYK